MLINENMASKPILVKTCILHEKTNKVRFALGFKNRRIFRHIFLCGLTIHTKYPTK